MNIRIEINATDVTIVCDIEQAKRFLMKNPAGCVSVTAGSATLVYDLEEVQVPTAILKTVRRNK
jgi:hypothetical protein